MHEARDVVDRELDDLAAGAAPVSDHDDAVAFGEVIPGAAEHDDEQEEEGELFAFHDWEGLARGAAFVAEDGEADAGDGDQRGHERDVQST